MTGWTLAACMAWSC